MNNEAQATLKRGIESGNIKEINDAINIGADPNGFFLVCSDPDELWPLVFLATENFHDRPDILETLLKAGANPNAQIIGVDPDDIFPNIGETLWSSLDWHDPFFFVYNEEGDIAKFLKMLMRYNNDHDLKIKATRGDGTIVNVPVIRYIADLNLNLSDDDIREIKDLYEKKTERMEMGQLKRNLVGHPKTIQYMMHTILDQPNSKKMRAFRATNPRWATNVADKTNLCSDLNNEMYKDELYHLAVDLDLPVTKKTSKRELCRLISQWYTEHENVAE